METSDIQYLERWDNLASFLLQGNLLSLFFKRVRNDHDLSKVVVEELFYFAFLSPSRTNIPNAVLDPVNMLRTEAGIEV